VLTEIEDNQVVSELTPNSILFRDRAVNILEVGGVIRNQNWLLPRTANRVFRPGEVTTSVQLTFSGFFCRRQDLLQRYFGWIRVYHDRVAPAAPSAVISGLHKHNLLFPHIFHQQ
jgi:hypothetical protein